MNERERLINWLRCKYNCVDRNKCLEEQADYLLDNGIIVPSAMEKATIYDYARMCKKYEGCKGCPLYSFNDETTGRCRATLQTRPDKANEIILNWCKEHPVETRQDRFLKMFPNTMKDEDVINIDPCVVDETLHLASPCWECAKKSNVEDCEECRRNYWLAEVDKNERGGATNE